MKFAGAMRVKLRFLCGAHRLELAKKPGMAIACWQNAFDTGSLLFDQQRWEEALPHLGCAFEAAEILMSTKAIDSKSTYELFTSSALLLLEAFKNIGDTQQSQHTYWMAVKRLTRELSSEPIEQAIIQEQLENLHQHGQYRKLLEQNSNFDTNCLHHPQAVLH